MKSRIKILDVLPEFCALFALNAFIGWLTWTTYSDIEPAFRAVLVAMSLGFISIVGTLIAKCVFSRVDAPNG